MDKIYNTLIDISSEVDKPIFNASHLRSTLIDENLKNNVHNTDVLSFNGITWTGVTGSTNIFSSCNDVKWNGKIWVAVGSGTTNTIAYSKDGITWSGLGISIFSSSGVCVGWNKNIWVAGGQGNTNTLAYSKDGISWTGLGKSIFATNARGIDSNGTRFVAVGQGSTTNQSLAYSDDGINWTVLNNILGSGYGISIAWNGTRWVFSGTAGLAFSSDGINWSVSPGYLYGTNNLASDKKKWIAVGFTSPSGSPIAYSKDGINWTAVVSTLFSTGIGATWNGTRFVAGGSLGTHTLAYSSDGVNWVGVTGSTGIFSTSCNCIGSSIQGNSLNSVNIQQPIIAVGDGSHTIIYSRDGIEWTGLGKYILNQGLSVTWNGKLWVAVGSGTNNCIAYSNDGIIWTGVIGSNDIFSSCYGVAWNGTYFFAVGIPIDTSTIAYSSDGITWTGVINSTNIFSIAAYDVSGTDTLWVAVGQGTNSIAYSTNGITGWTGVTGSINIFEYGYGVVCGNIWIAVGGGSRNHSIAYSTNGITGWTGVTGSTGIFTAEGVCVAWNGKMWVAGGQGTTNTLAYSSNGITGWTGLGKSIFSAICSDITWNGNIFVAVGNGVNTIAYSRDGIIWTGLGNTFFSSGSVGVGGGIGIAGNSNVGRVLVDSVITLNANVLPNTNRLDIFSDNYNNRGYSNLSVNIISNST